MWHVILGLFLLFPYLVFGSQILTDLGCAFHSDFKQLTHSTFSSKPVFYPFSVHDLRAALKQSYIESSMMETPMLIPIESIANLPYEETRGGRKKFVTYEPTLPGLNTLTFLVKPFELYKESEFEQSSVDAYSQFKLLTLDQSFVSLANAFGTQDLIPWPTPFVPHIMMFTDVRKVDGGPDYHMWTSRVDEHSLGLVDWIGIRESRQGRNRLWLHVNQATLKKHHSENIAAQLSNDGQLSLISNMSHPHGQTIIYDDLDNHQIYTHQLSQRVVQLPHGSDNYNLMQFYGLERIFLEPNSFGDSNSLFKHQLWPHQGRPLQSINLLRTDLNSVVMGVEFYHQGIQIGYVLWHTQPFKNLKKFTDFFKKAETLLKENDFRVDLLNPELFLSLIHQLLSPQLAKITYAKRVPIGAQDIQLTVKVFDYSNSARHLKTKSEALENHVALGVRVYDSTARYAGEPLPVVSLASHNSGIQKTRIQLGNGLVWSQSLYKLLIEDWPDFEQINNFIERIERERNW